MNKFTFFWKNRSPFSNWYPSIFTWNGITFTRGEQYMMYRKAMLFNDISIAADILKTDNPAEHKRLGRLVKNYNETIWSEHRVDIVVEGLIEKFKQNDKLKQVLLSTGNTIIAEASPVDKIWGIGLTEDDPLAQNINSWKGQNLLGIALMRVRDVIQ